MNRKQVFFNALTSVVQEIGCAVSLFFLYRFLVRSIGIERLGIWSLVLATTSFVALANQGFSTGIAKFVAKYAARQQHDVISLLVQTAEITVGIGVAVLCIALYPAARWILRFILPAPAIPEALAVIPYALISLWINLICSVLQAGLAGLEKITYRNYLIFGGVFLYLILSCYLVPYFGLLGLAYAQTLQALAGWCAAWVVLRRQVPGLPFLPLRWDRSLFREIRRYGAEFQLITLSQSVREPITKALLAKFGGLAATGYYDLALRWVINVRELVAQANEVLVPTVSSLQERSPHEIPAVYRDSCRWVFFFAVPAFALAVVLGPLVSVIWLGRCQPLLIAFIALLSSGWLVNVLSNPAYVVDLGTGTLGWVCLGCVLTACLNLGLGLLAGSYAGATAIVAASVCSLAIGYGIILVAYHVQNHAPFSQLLPANGSGLSIACFSAVALSLSASSFLAGKELPFRATASNCCVCAGIIIGAAWFHPLRKQLVHWVMSQVFA
jgi:O-antigen/teichoic acid export membrane protein